jgi:hypothetical protein
MSTELVLIIALFLWLLGLSAALFFIWNYFRTLSKQVKKGNLIQILSKVLSRGQENSKTISQIKREIKRIDQEGLANIKKIAHVRFNPFAELGGDHSFVLVLLDGEDNGILITGLHTRERTRVYVKEVRKGKCKLELSSEEKKALTKAMKKR